jgi:PBP1b-binding outer membrane lipoprotein LpoB
MLKKVLFSASVLALACFMSGCASSPATGYDLDNRVTNMRSTRKGSGEELRYVAQEAVKSILSNRRFENYLTSYKRTAKDEFDLPLLKLTKAQNRTDDPSLDMTALTDLIKTELINSGLVDVTMAEGTDVDASFAESRDLEYDDNFDQNTVAQRGTLQAATLVLRPRIISSRLSEGRLTQVIRTFVIDVADIRTGRIVFSFQKQLGVDQKRSVFGL